jgi:hypothetical protein
MGWPRIEGNTDMPEWTQHANFREVLPKGQLAASLRKLKLMPNVSHAVLFREESPDIPTRPTLPSRTSRKHRHNAVKPR